MTVQRQHVGALFTLHAEAYGQVLRVWFIGELSDRTATECRSDLTDPLLGREPIVVIDTGGLSAIDASGVAVLCDIKQQLESQGRRLLLCSLSTPIANALSAAAPRCEFDVLDGLKSQSHCDVCNGPLPTDLHVCPRCGAVL